MKIEQVLTLEGDDQDMVNVIDELECARREALIVLHLQDCDTDQANKNSLISGIVAAQRLWLTIFLLDKDSLTTESINAIMLRLHSGPTAKSLHTVFIDYFLQ